MSIFTKLSSFLSGLLPTREVGSLGVSDLTTEELLEECLKRSKLDGLTKDVVNRLLESAVSDKLNELKALGSSKLELLEPGAAHHDAKGGKALVQIKCTSFTSTKNTSWRWSDKAGVSSADKARECQRDAKGKGKKSYHAFAEWSGVKMTTLFLLSTEEVLDIFAQKSSGKGQDAISLKQFIDHGHTSLV